MSREKADLSILHSIREFAVLYGPADTEDARSRVYAGFLLSAEAQWYMFS